MSAVRAVYSGEVVGSTVRRNPSQQRYLKEVSSQISVMKLSGFLFFGTVAGIEEKVKSVINDDAHPVRFVVMDMFHVTGIDYSAGENFNTISRRLHNKRIELIFSAADPDSELGRSLRAIGVGADEVPVHFLPDLNSALEFCENELLKTLYSSQERLASQKIGTPLGYLGVPIQSDRPAALEMPMGSPRQSRLHEVALNVGRLETSRATRWKHLAEPLRLMMLIFHDLSGKNEDFWWGAASYFVRQEHKAGDVLFRRGDEAKGFYLLESGILRAEYDLPQGFLAESIAAGTTCGELPFFSETQRTATVIAERDCVTWMMDRDAWYRLERENVPVAQELLRISLKLTSERMSVFTNYILTTAS